MSVEGESPLTLILPRGKYLHRILWALYRSIEGHYENTVAMVDGGRHSAGAAIPFKMPRKLRL